MFNAMVGKSRGFIPESNPLRTMLAPRINLTLTQPEAGRYVIGVGVSEFIAYCQNTGFTRVNLRGGKVLDVKETTDQIDRLMRAASSQRNLLGT